MLNPDFRDILQSLSEEGADFLVVGAYAMGAHGAPRATGDIDVLVRPTRENAQKVWRALARFGAPLSDVTVEDFQSPDLVYQVGVPPGRIDVMTGISGVSFEEAWAGRESYRVEELTVSVIGRDELIRNKRATGRSKDLVDVETLEQLAAAGDTGSLPEPKREPSR